MVSCIDTVKASQSQSDFCGVGRMNMQKLAGRTDLGTSKPEVLCLAKLFPPINYQIKWLWKSQLQLPLQMFTPTRQHLYDRI